MAASSASSARSKALNIPKHHPPGRPDSLKLELLTIPEDSVTSAFSVDGLQSEQVNLEFKEITYSAWTGLLRRSRKDILRNVSGEFYAGDLTAIMGPSGAGKSTLMNILAGYTRNEVSGLLSENGTIRSTSVFRSRSCYIMQDDQLQPLLTVQEAMFVAANLKLPRQMSPIEKGSRVKEILKAIGLYESRKTRTGNLSGGQRKRLAIALELVRNPPVMFFDEPTSGLDSASSKQLVSLLKQLAQDGRTIICTIHQPSASIFEMFDHLYALSEGQCIYQGSIKGLVPYLEGAGLRCPAYHNPADYLLEVSRGEYGSHHQALVQLSQNGSNHDWRKVQRDSMNPTESLQRVEQMMRTGLVTPVRAPKLPFSLSTTTESKYQRSSPAATPTKYCCVTKPRQRDNYTASFFTQLYVLLCRTYLILSRDRQLTYGRLLTNLIIALIIGTLYFGIGPDAAYTLDNFNYLFFSVMFLMFTAFSSMIVAFANEMPILTREHFNRWYSVKSYFLAVTIADLPVQLIATLTYAVITFYMTMQPMEYYRFALFVVMCFLVSLVAQSIGQLVGAALSLQNGVIFGPLFIMPFVAFSGFFVHLNDAPFFLKWLFHLSFMKYGFEGIVHAIFGYNRGKLDCTEDYCHFVYPDKFIDQVGMTDAQYSFDVWCLVGFYFSLRLITYFALWIRVSGNR
ncbi:uncharacterized protein CBL_10667 [Carabus blaptoides fortunei]